MSKTYDVRHNKRLDPTFGGSAAILLYGPRVMTKREFFSGLSGARQVLFWVVATRRHLELWDEHVARIVAEDLRSRESDGQLIWDSQLDRHLTIVCLRNVLRALDVVENPPEVPSGIGETIKNVRDLLEHWDENMPIFNVSPRKAEPPRPPGKDFAKTHPDQTPYYGISWNGKRGSMVTPNLAAAQLHDLLDRLEGWAIEMSPSLKGFVHVRKPSPWQRDDSGILWPAAEFLSDKRENVQ